MFPHYLWLIVLSDWLQLLWKGKITSANKEQRPHKSRGMTMRDSLYLAFYFDSNPLFKYTGNWQAGPNSLADAESESTLTIHTTNTTGSSVSFFMFGTTLNLSRTEVKSNANFA